MEEMIDHSDDRSMSKIVVVRMFVVKMFDQSMSKIVIVISLLP